MAKGIEYLDEVNKRVYLGVDAGNSTTYTVQEIWSYIKNTMQLAPYIELDAIALISGLDEYSTGIFTGVIMKMLDGWELWTLNQGSKHRLIIEKGLVITEPAGGDPFGTPTNIVWSIAEQSVSALLTSTSSGSSRARTLDK